MRSLLLRGLAVVLASILSDCSHGGPVPPAPLDTRTDACASCRMAVSSPRLAAQIVAPGEEPRFFDDIGCLATFLREHPTRVEGSVIYVADHQTGSWVIASQAIYTRVPDVDTPMGSHLIAHADAGTREADPVARHGAPVDFTDALEAVVGPGAAR